MAKEINVSTLREWMKAGQVTLVDVREPSEWQASRIEGATLIPLAQATAETMPREAGKKLVIHCRSGKRSMTAADRILQQEPGREVYNLEGGILAWEATQPK